MTAQELLEQLNQLDEHTRVEAKKASELGESVLDTVCAFANEPGLGGGWILLGVAPRENSFWPVYEAVGVPHPDKVSADLASKCSTAFNQPIRVQVESTLINEKPVLVVSVPELPTSQKPLFFKKHGLPKGAFRRVGNTHLSRLRDRELLEMRGKGAGTFYIPTAKLLTGWPASGGRGAGPSDNLTPLSGNPSAQSGNLAPLSGNPPVESGNPAGGTTVSESLPPDLAAQIDKLPKRAPPKTVQDLVERICAIKAFSVEELAKQLGRDRQYILDSYVSPMVRDGRLKMTIPDQPNHPQQRYRAVVAEETSP